MGDMDRDIGSEDYKVSKLVDELEKDKLLIPTFQRDFVWDPANILKLWDSIYKFYPIGSILYWETDSYLHTHRKLGGFIFPHDEDTVRKFKEWQYVLDGQQRLTSLLVSMRGGKGRVEDNEDFDYTLYFDATKAEFFFAGDLPARKETVTSDRFLVRVREVPNWTFAFGREIAQEPGYDDTIERNLDKLQRVFSDYKVPVVHVRGVEVREVCDIFERINQEGKRLDPVDIMVARTYRNENIGTGEPGFYLRDNLEGLKRVLIDSGSRFQDLDDLTIIQMLAVCLRKEHKEGRNPYGITPQPLSNLETSDFEKNWERCQRTILDTIKFLHDLQIQGPGMLPSVYLALPLCYYLHQNRSPDRALMRQWFWRFAFTTDDLSNSSQVYEQCEGFFGRLEAREGPPIPPLGLSIGRLVETSYRYRSTLGRAVLAFLANQSPKDFADSQAVVLDNVYLLMTQAPNLHHIYPSNFLRRGSNLPGGLSPDSLMNICYLRAETNIRIGDKNPLEYFDDYRSRVRDFDLILDSHLIPEEYLSRQAYDPSDYRGFLTDRAKRLAERLVAELPDVSVSVVD